MSAAPSPVAWDYTAAAEAYLKRPGYAPDAIDAIVRLAGLGPGARVADVGAGTANLTLALASRGLAVVAIEPNAAMRRLGRRRTATQRQVAWRCAFAEATTLADASCDAAGFGSSFNVVEPRRAVAESARIVRSGGALFCLWNHRRLDDPLQAAIEDAIRRRLPHYSHGTRRDDPSAAMSAGGWFGDVQAIEAAIVHTLPRAEFAAAWRAHLTLQRQAGDRFEHVLADIDRLLDERAPVQVRVPYVTRGWVARRFER